MPADKHPFPGNTAMLILKLLEKKDMYGYQIIEELARLSCDAFKLKTGTLYPLLHGLEKDAAIESYEETAAGARVRRYYKLTDKGKTLLNKKASEWSAYADAVYRVLNGGASYAR